MTGKDEITLKNPDALINGEAVKSLIRSCVPGVLKPEELLSNDVDALIVAIRSASYGDSMDVISACPKCKHENAYAVDLSTLLAIADKLNPDYPVPLSSGLTVFVKPYTYKQQTKVATAAFKQTRAVSNLQQQDLTEDQKLKEFGKSLNALTEINLDLVANSIIKFIDEKNGVEIYNTPENLQMVLAFLQNISKTDSDLIRDTISKINLLGINREIKVLCEKCSHEWTSSIEVNPVNFFKDS
jgi:hypothetical protein